MVKPLQLFSIAVASATPVDDPQVLLQFGQIKQQKLGEGHLISQVGDMQTRMEEMVQQAVETGATPELEKVTYDTLLNALTGIEQQLIVERDENDEDWDDVNDAVAKCNDHLLGTRNEVDNYERQYTSKKDEHKTCRSMEDAKRGTEKDAYDAQEEAAENAHGSTPQAEVCAQKYSNAEAVKVSLEKAAQWIKSHNNDLTGKIAAYKAAKDDAAKKAQECDDVQRASELDFCEYEVSLKAACGDHGNCIFNAQAARDRKRVQLKKKEEAEKLIFKTCSKVRCYLALLHNGKAIRQAAYDACKKDDADASSLNMKWTAEQEADECDASDVDATPGSSYEDLKPTKVWRDGFRGLEDPTPCKSETAEAVFTGLYCVAQLNKNNVKGPYYTLEEARVELNKETGSGSNQQMVCGMTVAAGSNNGQLAESRATYNVGEQGRGPAGGFQKWWGNWGQIDAMQKMCDSQCSAPVPTTKNFLVEDFKNDGCDSSPTAWNKVFPKIPMNPPPASMRLTMGTVVDYFKPKDGASWREMISSHDRYLFSSDNENWVQPDYYHHHWGGSKSWWPRDNIQGDARKHLSFWAVTGNYPNYCGCCSKDLSGQSSNWKQGFTLEFLYT